MTVCNRKRNLPESKKLSYKRTGQGEEVAAKLLRGESPTSSNIPPPMLYDIPRKSSHYILLPFRKKVCGIINKMPLRHPALSGAAATAAAWLVPRPPSARKWYQ